MILRYVNKEFTIQINETLQPYIQCLSTANLTDEEKNIFTEATNLIVKSEELENLRRKRLIFIFSATADMHLTFNSGQYGSHFCLASIIYSHWTNFSNKEKLICIVEELVHHFWDEDDELEVSRIVCTLIDELDYNPETGAYKY
ncbi:hypothetical protein [Priestia megaterium]|uniref:hypothetical protein n=1 Tax=Priestia megaterium TaxID=1404 RepID=UPI00194E9912|nr:hypothetical protein [Priestia megaterium]MBM6602205.1 hypothetical protein [Priestia megaterium]